MRNEESIGHSVPLFIKGIKESQKNYFPFLADN